MKTPAASMHCVGSLERIEPDNNCGSNRRISTAVKGLSRGGARDCLVIGLFAGGWLAPIADVVAIIVAQPGERPGTQDREQSQRDEGVMQRRNELM